MAGSQDNLLAFEKKRSWIYDPGLRHLYLLLCIPLATSYSVGYDGSVLNGLQSSPYWQNYFDHPKGGILGLFNAMQSIGNLCALPFTPFVVDWIGRRYTILGGSLVMCIGVGIMTGAQNFEYFVWGRWLVGFGLAFCTMAGPLLVTELAYHKQRVTLTSIYHWAYDIGSLFAAWITFGTTNSKSLTNTWAWRIPCLIQALSAIVQVVGILFVPESPRWLIKQGRIDEAVEIMAKYHANGDRDDPYVKFETEQIHLSLEEEKITKEYRWKDLYSTPGNRKRTNIVILVGLFSQWSGNSLISYYLTGILNTVGITSAFDQQLVNGCKTIWSFSITLFAALIVHKFRRRSVFLFSSGGMLLAFTIWTILSALYAEGAPSSVGIGVIVMIFSHSGFYAPSWLALLYTYTLEISTLNMRAKIQMVLGISQLAALVTSQYVNPIALNAIGWKFYLVYEIILVFEVAIIYFYFAEPRGRTLEEAATTFADTNAADVIFHVRDEVAEKSATQHVEHIESVEN